MGLGFLWMFVWALIGGLLGAKVNTSAIAADPSWLQSWERTLFRTAHAHMSTMGLTLVVAALALPRLGEMAKGRAAKLAMAFLCFSPPVFAAGLIMEGLNPPVASNISFYFVVTIIGGFGYFMGLALIGCLALVSGRRGT
jgi:hypothetical protein